MSFLFFKWFYTNTLKSEQNGCHFVDAIFICIFVKDSNCLFVVHSSELNPDSKVHVANIGPTWVLSVLDGPHVGPHEPCYQVIDRKSAVFEVTA